MPGHGAQGEDRVADVSPERNGPYAIDWIEPATIGRSQTTKRNRAKYILPRPAKRSWKNCKREPEIGDGQHGGGQRQGIGPGSWQPLGCGGPAATVPAMVPAASTIPAIRMTRPTQFTERSSHQGSRVLPCFWRDRAPWRTRPAMGVNIIVSMMAGTPSR